MPVQYINAESRRVEWTEGNTQTLAVILYTEK